MADCDDVRKIWRWLETFGRERAIAIETRLTAVPALAPESGGQGEMAKARVVEEALPASFAVERCDSPDPRVPEERRPNIIARMAGKRSRTLWLMGHLDVVPPGEPELWTADPWTLRVEGDLLYGRGAEDNQQAITSMLLLAEAADACGVSPENGLGLLFVADEECGSRHGAQYILRKRRDLFAGGDLLVVPDMGVSDGSVIEVAEKSIFWVRVEVEGVQCHGSTPEKGKNTLAAAAEMIVHMDDVAARFPARDPLFTSASTFTPTRYEENVPNVNTVPGRGVFYVDCRVLPGYTLDDVLAAFRSVFLPVAERHGVTVSFSLAQDTPAAPVTPPDSPVVAGLVRSIGRVLGVRARCVGIGGGTVAAFFRRAGIPAAVWATQDSTMHSPDENARVSHIIGDAKVFADMLFARDDA